MDKYRIGDIVWINPSDTTPREATIIGTTPDGRPQIQCVNDHGEVVSRVFSHTRVCFYNDKPEL